MADEFATRVNLFKNRKEVSATVCDCLGALARSKHETVFVPLTKDSD